MKKAKTKKSTKTTCCQPRFEPNRSFGFCMDSLIVTDGNGTVWLIDASGRARKIEFSQQR